jgi:hypothetical protein
MSVSDLVGSYYTTNLANEFKTQNKLDLEQKQKQTLTKNFESVAKFSEYLKQFPDNSKTLKQRIESFAMQGFTINGQPLNENPEVLQMFLRENINTQVLLAQIQNKNFVNTGNSSAEQNAMFALADDAKARGISIYQSTVDAGKNGFKINGVPILENPMFAGAQAKLEAQNTQQPGQQQQTGQQSGQPQQGPQNG